MPDNADLIAWLRDERRLCPPSEWLRATDAAAAALEAADERIAALNERHAAFVKLNTAMFDNVARERDTARERIAALERVIAAADAMRDMGVSIGQQVVHPEGMPDDRALYEFIGLFDGPFQRDYDAARAALEGK